MMKKTGILALAAAVMILSPGCSLRNSSEVVSDSYVLEEGAEAVEAIRFGPGGAVCAQEQFLDTDSGLILSAPEGASVYYTLDGSLPDKESELYSEPIMLYRGEEDFPECIVIRAKAWFSDGSESETVTKTFWCFSDTVQGFKTPVIAVTGDPATITDAPDGIFYGNNKKLRGRESEREVSLELFSADGAPIFLQQAGMRLFGAYSRDYAVKSMKLFARKEYDPEHGKFSYDSFATPDAEGGVISSYDKLVLRSAGNDFQFAFVRDELFQILARQSGYTDCEGVIPVTVYLNGKYYGLHWLHEAVCDDLLKDKYGGKAGEYIVLEGKEKKKDVPDNEKEAAAAEEFNSRYDELCGLDLTDDESFAKAEGFLDIENYLQYYAFNIVINNRDWPQNNQKCYRYYAGEGEQLSEGRTDGKWRFWFHDMDYSAGLYEQDETRPYYNNLAEILNPKSERYSPLFAALMQREDCRDMFISEAERLMDTTLSEENIDAVLDEIEEHRGTEMERYYRHLEELKESDKSVWTWYGDYQTQVKRLRRFARNRNKNMRDFIQEAFFGTSETETSEASPEASEE